jgi:hypothetical protein
LFVVEGVRGYGRGLVEPVRGAEVAEVLCGDFVADFVGEGVATAKRAGKLFLMEHADFFCSWISGGVGSAYTAE